MRVRITKALTGSIDGIQLSRLSKGQVYDVYTSLACYLLSEEVAEPALNDEPAAILPLEKKLFQQPTATRTGIVLPRSLAADRSRKKKKPKPTGS
jgi:hypothetical protein